MSARPRVVSLLPSSTEIVCALGMRDALVGRSHECDFPAGVEALPALTAPKLDVAAPSRVIDARVKELVARGLSVYRVDAERLRALAPDVVITQTQCDVCAASLADVEAALADWLGAGPQLVALEPADLGSVWGSFVRVAQALGVPERGPELAAESASRMTELAERAGQLLAAGAPRPRVACLEWIDPPMAAGNWMPELVYLAGGEPVFGIPGQHSPWIELEQLADADPDALVVLPCGFDLARTRAELGPLLESPVFRGLRCVREGRAHLADGHQFFNRPGPRLVESLEILCEILHPGAFAPGWRGRGWEELPRV